MTKSKSKPLDFIGEPNAVETYCKEIKNYRGLTLAEEQALGREIQGGSKQALQSLVQANLKFVVAVCRNYNNRGLPFGDLINEGNLGLIRAARRFDGAMNFKFISYAVWWIRQGILTALAEQSRSLNISTSRIEAMRKIATASRALEQELDRVPSVEELSERSGKSVEVIIECRLISATPLSLNRTIGGDGDTTLEDRLEDKDGEKPDRAALQHLLGKRVKTMMSKLGEREQTVIRLYYGIGSDANYSLTEIGLRLNLTRERIRQIKEKALQRLRKPLGKTAQIRL